MMGKCAVILFLLLFIFACGGSPGKKPGKVEKIFFNGHIVTMDKDKPVVTAMAVGEGKIVLTGSGKEIKKRFPPAETVELKGKTLMPGIIESHGHLFSLGQSFLELNLEGVKTPAEAIEKVHRRVQETPEGEWIIGWGWDEGAWAKNYPNNKALSEISPANPVYLRGLHGFASWINDLALKAGDIGADTPNPPQGEILKDAESGKPTGILTNKAQDLLSRHIPPMSLSQMERALELAIDRCVANGLTSVQEANTSSQMLAALRSLKKKKKLKSRVYVMLDGTDKELIDSNLEKGPEIDPEHMLVIRCVKIFVDGALGSRGAAFMEPYSDAPGVKGVIVTPEDKL